MTVTQFQDLPLADRDREWGVKDHLARYYEKMDDSAPRERDGDTGTSE